MPADTIDLDDFNTWPETTRQWANKYADRLRDSTVFASDLALSPELEDEFRQTFGQRKVLAYHARGCCRTRPRPSEPSDSDCSTRNSSETELPARSQREP